MPANHDWTAVMCLGREYWVCTKCPSLRRRELGDTKPINYSSDPCPENGK